jgi:hypothetical protein
MLDLSDIKKAVQELPDSEYRDFRRWFEELDTRAWDEQFEDDVRSGRLDEIAEKTLEKSDRLNEPAIR